jgi:hypothetical protein
MRFLVALSFFFLVVIFTSKSEIAVSSNKKIIDSLLNDFSVELSNKIKVNELNNVSFYESDFFPAYFSEYIILKTQKAINNSSNSNINIKLKLSVNNFIINYSNINNSEFERIIDLEITSFLIEKDGSLNVFTHQSYKFKDTLLNIEQKNIEDENFPFTKGKFPPQKKSFFDEILEPTIIIATSIISVVLFFSVRSK